MKDFYIDKIGLESVTEEKEKKACFHKGRQEHASNFLP
jgi:hypothetical protein